MLILCHDWKKLTLERHNPCGHLHSMLVTGLKSSNKRERSWNLGENLPSNSQVGKKAGSLAGSVGTGTCSLTSLRVGGLLDLASHHQVMLTLNIKLSVISPTKMGLKLAQKCKSRQVRYSKPYASPKNKREGRLFYRGEWELQKALLNKKSIGLNWELEV